MSRVLRRTASRLVASFLILGLASVAGAITIHDESLDGDLSTSPATPTALNFAPGSNVVIGTITNAGDTRDYLTFTLDAGEELVALNLLVWEDLPGGGPADTAFQTLSVGATSAVPTAGNIGTFIGASHIPGSFAGTDILDNLAGTAFGATGFSIPIGAGTYTYNIQQTGSELNGYELEFVITPEPSLGLLGLLAAVCLGVAGRRAE